MFKVPVTLRHPRLVGGAVLGIALIAATVAIWLRNHDILRDLYDYSTVINAVGKLEAGLKPYTGVTSPMQTSVYYFNWIVEQVFGASYRGLTWGGLVQALGGGLLLAWLTTRRWNLIAGVIVAGAVVLAGLIQHMVFFYNPIGILCLAIVLVGVGGNLRLWPPRGADAWLVIAALMIGGTNKINFQAFTLAMAGALFFHAWLVRRFSFRDLVTHVGILLVAGIAIPIAFEMAWTGASFREWCGDVILRSSGRAGLVGEVLSPAAFLQPPRDFYHHILFRPMGGIGLLLLLTVGVWALVIGVRVRVPAWAWLARLGLVLGGVAGSTLLMLSNNEIVTLTSLGFLICALALFLACRRIGDGGDERIGRVLLIGAGVWVIGGGYSAWHASRVLFGSDPPPSTMFTRLREAPRPLAYFQGVRFVRSELVVLLDLAARLEAMEDADGRLQGVLFGPAMEWLERAYPEAAIPGLPIWYDTETGIIEEEGPWFRALMEERRIDCVVTDPSWESWPSIVRHSFDVDFRAERLGQRVRLYHRRMPVSADGRNPPPISRTFRDATRSNIALGATTFSGELTLSTKPGGAYWGDSFWGAGGSSTWDWRLPVGPLAGQAVVASAADEGPPVPVIFQIWAVPPGARELLWEHAVTIHPGDAAVEQPFRITPGDRPIQLKVEIPASESGRVQAGWTKLNITGATRGIRENSGLPFLAELARRRGEERPDELTFVQRGELARDPALLPVPFERWQYRRGSGAHVTVTVDLLPGGSDQPPPVFVGLLWYRAGRFEILAEREVHLREPVSISLTGKLPEPGGAWIGVWVRQPGPDGSGEKASIVQWRHH